MRNAYNRSKCKVDTRRLADAIDALREIADEADGYDFESLKFETFIDRQTDGGQFESLRKEWK